MIILPVQLCQIFAKKCLAGCIVTDGDDVD